MDHLQINGAFLYVPLPKSAEVYIGLPRILGVPEASGDIFNLRLSLYRLHQAPKLRYELVEKKIKKIGFRRYIVEYAIFITTWHGQTVYKLV